MKNTIVSIFCLVFIGTTIAYAEPKAFDYVDFAGRTETCNVLFRFAEGYPEASEMIVRMSGKKEKTYYCNEISNKQNNTLICYSGNEKVSPRFLMEKNPEEANVYDTPDQIRVKIPGCRNTIELYPAQESRES